MYGIKTKGTPWKKSNGKNHPPQKEETTQRECMSILQRHSDKTLESGQSLGTMGKAIWLYIFDEVKSKGLPLLALSRQYLEPMGWAETTLPSMLGMSDSPSNRNASPTRKGWVWCAENRETQNREPQTPLRGEPQPRTSKNKPPARRELTTNVPSAILE